MAGRQTFRMLIVGKSGSGKSTLARQIIRCMRVPHACGDEALQLVPLSRFSRVPHACGDEPKTSPR
jgi:ABC-type glutathione transport system ATPase component